MNCENDLFEYICIYYVWFKRLSKVVSTQFDSILIYLHFHCTETVNSDILTYLRSYGIYYLCHIKWFQLQNYSEEKTAHW